jgi:hypothetical protein
VYHEVLLLEIWICDPLFKVYTYLYYMITFVKIWSYFHVSIEKNDWK